MVQGRAASDLSIERDYKCQKRNELGGSLIRTRTLSDAFRADTGHEFERLFGRMMNTGAQLFQVMTQVL
jgi:hypothetical protein